MKNLFLILIFIPLFVSIKFPITDWEWNWNLDWFNDFVSNLKTGVPEFFTKLNDKVKDFIKKTEKEKDIIIQEFRDKALAELNKTAQTSEKMVKDLIEYTTTASKYISYKICNATNMTSYEECRNNKKAVFKQLVKIVQDEFQCSQIIGIITDHILKENLEDSIKYVLFLINSITNNPDAIERGKAQVIYEMMYCLESKIEENWPEIKAKLKNQDKIIEFKQDITNILVQSMENLVSIIHFEELDGYIEKADEKTGLIPNEYAKSIQQHLFKVLQKLNEFGTNFYNLSATLSVNVTARPENRELDITQKLVTDFKEKGIKIELFSDFLFQEYNAYSIQTVVFDSPLVSIRGKRETEGGTSNTFVGITIYGKDGKEYKIDDINISKYRPIIYYKKKLFNAMTTCLFYNEKDDKIENSGVETETVKFDGEEYINCIPKHLTTFTIGSYKSANVSGKSNTGTIILVIFLVLLFIGAGVGGFFYWKKRKLSSNNSQMNQAFPNRDGLLSN